MPINTGAKYKFRYLTFVTTVIALWHKIYWWLHIMGSSIDPLWWTWTIIDHTAIISIIFLKSLSTRYYSFQLSLNSPLWPSVIQTPGITFAARTGAIHVNPMGFLDLLNSFKIVSTSGMTVQSGPLVAKSELEHHIQSIHIWLFRLKKLLHFQINVITVYRKNKYSCLCILCITTPFIRTPWNFGKLLNKILRRFLS